MFGFIKNLFGGIFGFLGRLLGLKKSEYFLDLDGGSAKDSAKAEPAKAQKSEPAKAQSLAAVAAPAKLESASSDKKSEPVAAKAEKAKNSNKEKQPAPKPAIASPAIASTNGKVPTQSAPAMTFAPNYLMPTPTANRRLPGPSMNNFRDMARQMKTSK